MNKTLLSVHSAREQLRTEIGTTINWIQGNIEDDCEWSNTDVQILRCQTELYKALLASYDAELNVPVQETIRELGQALPDMVNAVEAEGGETE